MSAKRRGKNPDFKKVKIIATLGSVERDAIFELAQAGVDVFRLNLSHMSAKDAKTAIDLIKKAEKEAGRPLSALMDLAGPKVRLEEVEEGAELKTGAKIRIVSKSVTGTDKEFSLNYSSAIGSLKKGATVFLGDGDAILEVISAGRKDAAARVVVGGKIRSKMGFSARGMEISESSLTPRDKKDLKALASHVSAVAVSFVRNGNDIKKVRRALPSKAQPMIIAKIETEEGVKNAESILNEADGVMIARGDLGLSVPMEEVPFIQKDLIKMALKNSKPVITATQMLDSMTENPLPTRAEVSDVTAAILDGTDAVMFSGETARGHFPKKVIEMARAIITACETKVPEREFPGEGETADAISSSAVKTAKQAGAKLIIVLTESGKTAQRISRHRYDLPIVAMSPHESTIRKMNFVWGVAPLLENKGVIHNFDKLLAETQKVAKNNSVRNLKKGDTFVISAGVPFEKSGTTNLVLVEKVE